MHKEGDEVHVDDVEASGGRKDGVVRWILGISLFLALVVMSMVWIIPALTDDDNISDAQETEREMIEEAKDTTVD